MAGIPHDHYEPGSKSEKWLHSRLPIVGLLYDTIMLPTPKNLNWMWIWGVVLTSCSANHNGHCSCDALYPSR